MSRESSGYTDIKRTERNS